MRDCLKRLLRGSVSVAGSLRKCRGHPDAWLLLRKEAQGHLCSQQQELSPATGGRHWRPAPDLGDAVSAQAGAEAGVKKTGCMECGEEGPGNPE